MQFGGPRVCKQNQIGALRMFATLLWSNNNKLFKRRPKNNFESLISGEVASYYKYMKWFEFPSKLKGIYLFNFKQYEKKSS